MRGSRNFRQGGGGGGCPGSRQVSLQSDKKKKKKKKSSTDNVFFFFFFFFFSPQLILQKSNGQFQTNLSFFKVQEGVQHFPGGGSNFFQGGSNCLFPIETHITCDFQGGGVRTPCPPSGSALAFIMKQLHVTFETPTTCNHYEHADTYFSTLSSLQPFVHGVRIGASTLQI